MSRVLAYEDSESQAPLALGLKWYLCHFAHKYLNFRTAELEALAGMAGCPAHAITWRMPTSTVPELHPFWAVALPSDEVAQKVASRSMLTKGLYELWGEGGSWEELEAAIKAYPDHLKAPWIAENLSFKINVCMHGKALDMATQLDYMHRLMYVDFKGKVNLKQPDVVFRLQVVDNNGVNGLGDAGTLPFRLYFGRQVAAYSHAAVLHYNLPARPYIGPTSMDPEMAFIMCNQAQVQRGHLVCDPYIGTGSIAVAAAHHGAYVMGTDIDIRVVKMGKVDASGQPLDIYTNFRHYGMPGRLLGLVAADMHTPCWRQGLEGIFHSIIGDPPYGVRAGGRKLVARDIVIHDRETHIMGTGAYSLGECMRDLLDYAARMLIVGGRLVFFLPATIETYDESELPAHPALKILYNTEQLLHKRYSRRLITMEKHTAYDAAAAATFHAAKPDPTMRIDQLHDLVYEQYERDEKGKLIYSDAVLSQRKFRGKKL